MTEAESAIDEADDPYLKMAKEAILSSMEFEDEDLAEALERDDTGQDFQAVALHSPRTTGKIQMM